MTIRNAEKKAKVKARLLQLIEHFGASCELVGVYRLGITNAVTERLYEREQLRAEIGEIVNQL